jgi:hypothetical protein
MTAINRRRGRRALAAILFAASPSVLLVACATRPDESSPPPAVQPADAVADCDLPGNLDKAGTTLAFRWTPMVELVAGGMDSVVLTSDLDVALCSVGRDGSGVAVAVTRGIGRLDPLPRPVLTYDGASSGPASPTLVYGRVPAGTSTIVVTDRDGATSTAVVDHGFYLAALPPAEGTQVGPRVTEIAALREDGTRLVSLASSDGLDPGVRQ